MEVKNSILERVHFPIEGNEPFSFDVKRDDLIDPVISGNKWRKLEYNFLKMKEFGKTGILTFGGAFSNHLIATAKATHDAGLQSIGIVRGEELTETSNDTLITCTEYGMQLIFISREDYRLKDEPFFRNELTFNHPDYFIVPEGGKGFLGAMGCQVILSETENDYDHVYVAGGTGTTGAGVLLSANEKTKVHVVSALKGDFLVDAIRSLLYKSLFEEEMVNELMENLIVEDDTRFGGYARASDELIDFINQVYSKTKLKLDPIYTGKAFYQLIADYQHGKIKKGEKVLFIHTGGLQGAASWRDKLTYFKNV